MALPPLVQQPGIQFLAALVRKLTKQWRQIHQQLCEIELGIGFVAAAGKSQAGQDRCSVAGTRLTLWSNIGHRFIAMGAAGWHICFDVLDLLLAGQPIGRIAGPEAMNLAGWQRLNAEYSQQFGIETLNFPPKTAQDS